MDDLTTRRCWECTACCITHEVGEIGKPSGSACGHCNVGVGCRVYSDRPTACRDFRCLWLIGTISGESERPDITGIVCDISSRGGLSDVLRISEFKVGALEGPSAVRFSYSALTAGKCVVHVDLAGRSVLYVPKGYAITREVLKTLMDGGVKVLSWEPKRQP